MVVRHARDAQCPLRDDRDGRGHSSELQHRYRYLRNKSTATVIVVDDDTSIRRALRRQLQILGFSVVDFESAEEFLTGEVPTEDACLLLDVYMPGMTGIELCRNLIAAGRRLPTILISGRDDEQTRQMMRKANPIASLLKPFDEKKLLSAIRKALRSGLNSQS
jgi:FixJ family two-component response regulator